MSSNTGLPCSNTDRDQFHHITAEKALLRKIAPKSEEIQKTLQLNMINWMRFPKKPLISFDERSVPLTLN